MIIAYGQRKSENIEKWSYYLNRFARIYPVYLFALILSVIKFMMIDVVPLKELILQLFVIQSWFPGHIGKLNTPGWSLSVEALFYLSFPFLFNNFYTKFSLRSVSILVFILWFATQILLNYIYLSPHYLPSPSKIHDFIFYFPLMHINEFMIGNVLGFVYLNSAKKQRNLDVPLTISVIAMLAVLLFITSVSFHDGLMAILFSPVILLLSLNSGIITKIFSNKYLVLLGEASYGMYILQSPIKSFSSVIFKKIHLVNETFQFYAFMVILIVTSILCYFLIEIPAKDWIKSWKKRKVRKLQPADDTVNF